MDGSGDAVNISVDSGDSVSENHIISFRALALSLMRLKFICWWQNKSSGLMSWEVGSYSPGSRPEEPRKALPTRAEWLIAFRWKNGTVGGRKGNTPFIRSHHLS